MKVDAANLKAYPEQVAEMENEGPSEGGFVTQTFVKWLFEMWKLRAKIIKTRAEILAAGQFIEYTHRLGDFVNQKQTSFNSGYLFKYVSNKSEQLTKEAKEKTR